MIEIGEPGTCPVPVADPKVYVLVRRDLPWPVRCVQATHVVMQLVRTRKIEEWGAYGPAVVILGVADEQELRQWYTGQLFSEWPVGFKEPDLNNELTAVAYYGQPILALTELRLM